jgi:hypothetical protein
LLYGSHLRVAVDKLSSFLVELHGYQQVTWFYIGLVFGKRKGLRI